METAFSCIHLLKENCQGKQSEYPTNYLFLLYPILFLLDLSNKGFNFLILKKNKSVRIQIRNKNE